MINIIKHTVYEIAKIESDHNLMISVGNAYTTKGNSLIHKPHKSRMM